MFEYKKLGKFTYNIIKDPKNIKPFLLKWVGKEWENDYKEDPNQPWTLEWIVALKKMEFSLEVISIDDINPREDLMNYKTDNYSFIDELNDRTDEREESLLRGVSSEPLLINKNGFELMDGYTRYMVLKRHNEKQTYAYIGTVKENK